MEASYDGALDVAGGIALDGNVNFKSPSVQALGNWAGRPIAAGRGCRRAQPVQLPRRAPAAAYRWRGLTATLGETSLDGCAGDREQGGAAPCQRHPEAFGARSRRHPDPPGPPGPSPGAQTATADPIDDCCGARAPAKGPQVRGFTKRAGSGADWSDDSSISAPLGLADADLALSADRLVYKDVKTGPDRLSLKLEDSVAKLTLEEMHSTAAAAAGM